MGGPSFDIQSEVVTGKQVGIGVSGPARKLHVKGDNADAPSCRLSTGAGGTPVELDLSGDENNHRYDVQVREGTGTWLAPITIKTDTGRVGIDTLNPGEKLEVNGNVKVAGKVISQTADGSLLRDVANEFLSLSGGYTRRGANTSGGLIQLMGNARAQNPGSIQYILGEGATSHRHIFYNNGPDATILEIASIDNSGNLRARGNIGSLATGRVAVDADGYCLYG